MLLRLMILIASSLPWLIASSPALSKQSTSAQETTQTISIAHPHTEIQLHNLNPAVGRWYVLSFHNAQQQLDLHLESSVPRQLLMLARSGMRFVDPDGGHSNCPLWQELATVTQAKLGRQKTPFYPLCHGRLMVRIQKPTTTRLSTTEWATQILRQQSFGESLINLVKPLVVGLEAEEATIERSTTKIGTTLRSEPQASNTPPPRPARLASQQSDLVASEHSLGITLQDGVTKPAFGRWYPAAMHEGVFISLMAPRLLPQDITASYPKRVHPLDDSEQDNLVYLVAYDLNKYSLEFVAGIKHPSLAPGQEVSSSKSHRHLVRIGTVPPHRMRSAVAVFTGGYKGRHSRVQYGPMRGKTYGYIESGVEMLPLSPGLATLSTDSRGEVTIGEWAPRSLERSLYRGFPIVSARQNGVLLMDRGEPTIYIRHRGWGNWSGDAKGNLRTLRAAVCMQEPDKSGSRYLLFAGFTGATPSAVVRVLQGYRCANAMQLDMNAYIYIHNALFSSNAKGKLKTEYLHTEMEYPKGTKFPRYILDNNDRDFFYLFRKDPGTVTSGDHLH